MIISNNQTPSSVEKFSNRATNVKDPIHFFFIERYEQAYRDQFNEFIKCVENKTKPKVNFEDGRNALIIAANESGRITRNRNLSNFSIICSELSITLTLILFDL